MYLIFNTIDTAAYKAFLAVVKVLLKHGVSATTQASVGRSTLHSCCLGSPVNDVSSRIYVAEFLIDQGVDVNSRDDSGWIPLHLACKLIL